MSATPVTFSTIVQSPYLISARGTMLPYFRSETGVMIYLFHTHTETQISWVNREMFSRRGVIVYGNVQLRTFRTAVEFDRWPDSDDAELQ
jgi:hypothetical protein